MKDTTKKALAREWLYLLVGLLIGMVASLGMGLSAFNRSTNPFVLFDILFDPDERGFLFTWVFVMSPYLLFQLVRSIRWALKTIKS